MAYTTIDKGSKYFDTSLWSGNDGTQSITTLNFKPDFLWLKSRNTAVGHQLIDVIRGTGKQLNSNDTASEASPTYPYVSTLDTNGWTMTNGSLSGGNTTGRTYVGWSWLGGGTGVSNTSGTITSTVSANTTSGFSIVSYTGTGANATVGHGLGAVPKMIITKGRTNSYDWVTYHSSLGAGTRIFLNTTGASSADTGQFNNTSPTSSVFSLGSYLNNNESSITFISYCFAEVKGFSKIGSYTGNGSTDGTFVYTGFKPAFVLIKPSTIVGDWYLFDNKRIGYNDFNAQLYPNLSNAEAQDNKIDLFSNGFKIRSTGTSVNGSGTTYIYIAFAENPFVSSKGIPTTAR